MKGIWEKINYPEDLKLTSVFFISADVGYVSGSAGTILKTTDGGNTWTAQLGGDPLSEEPEIWGLQFIDETHGWAKARYKLLRTTDGKRWEQIASTEKIPGSYFFTSPSTVFLAKDNKISRSKDAGRSFKEVFTCTTKLDVDGLSRQISCENFRDISFPSASVGYAITAMYNVEGAFAIAKTIDAGNTWATSIVQHTGRAENVLFIGENVGFVRVYGGTVFRTTDGGATWNGITANLGEKFRFADPEVGWSIHGNTMVYTTDGGDRWFSRKIAFPATPNDFSLPCRDRAYVVGDHGMIYRYRVVPASEVVDNSIPAPAMPIAESHIDEDIQDIVEKINALEDSIEFIESQDSLQSDTAHSAWDESRFAAQIAEIQAAIDSLSAAVPEYSNKFRNLNLLLEGLKQTEDLIKRSESIGESFSNFRKASDVTAALQSLREFSKQAEGLESTMKEILH